MTSQNDKHRADELEIKIDELEIKAAFQEQLIADLNEELIQHGARIASLEKQLQRVVDVVKSQAQDSTESPEDERPPHY
ncbi:MAG: SlyX family protein [Gammaproteobacteria bacterium]|nr:SlyX family protein [Gammaproteobacteria bacterium]